MPVETTNVELNRLLIELSRSLLQYVHECWPWSNASQAEERRVVEACAARQRDRVAELAELLDRREWPVEFGTFPTAYTDLHYVSLDYLLALLIDDARGVAAELESALSRFADDAEAHAILVAALAGQREIARDVERLASAATVGPA